MQDQSNLPVSVGKDGGPFEVGSFDFHGKPVIVLSNEHGNWAVLGQLCRNLTLDANGQRQMLDRNAWSAGRTCVTHVQLPGDTQARQHFLIHERIVPMWLANITASRISDLAIRESVEQAQIELADALHDYVTRRVKVPAITEADIKRTALARAREMVDYRMFRDMMRDNATDYEPSSRETRLFFAMMQNDLYRHITGMTADEIKHARKLQTWEGRADGKPEPGPKSQARKVAKNYLTEIELRKLERLVGRLCLRAEDLAEDGERLSLAQWQELVNAELAVTRRALAA